MATMKEMTARLLLLLGTLAMAVAPPLMAQDIARVLVPIDAYRLNGVNGSLWSTRLWLRNSDVNPVWLSPTTITDWSPGPGAELELTIGGANGPVFLSYSPSTARLQFALRLFEESSGDRTLGTEIPVVRERDLVPGTVSLLPIPLDARYRATLRVYTFPPNRWGRSEAVNVTVHIFSFGAKNELLSVPLSLASENGATTPGYAQLPLDSLVAGVTPKPTNLRVEVEPATPATPVWAFVTSTNNVTQQVTLVTPR